METQDEFKEVLESWSNGEAFASACEEKSLDGVISSIPSKLIQLISIKEDFRNVQSFWDAIPKISLLFRGKEPFYKIDFQLLAKLAIERLSLIEPGWDAIAMLFLREHIRLEFYEATDGIEYSSKSLRKSFESYLNFGIKKGYLVSDLDKKYDVRHIADNIQLNWDFNFTYLGLKTLYDKYLIKDFNRKVVETPQFMFMAIAMFLAQNEERLVRTSWANKFYKNIGQFKIMVATPILANARTTRLQLNSCYVGSTSDSIESLFDSFKKMALISKNGGGIGWDFTKVRGIGSSIDGIKNVGGGLVPWLKITNDIAVAVDQLGTRKGAIAAWCEIWHIDIEDFIELRKNSGDERRRAHDLFPALWICDEFMSRVIDDKEWTLLDPHDFPHLAECYGIDFANIYNKAEEDLQRGLISAHYKVVRAKDLWKKILLQLFETGLPFIGFKDIANQRNMLSEMGLIRSSNLCTEIFQNTDPGEERINLSVIQDGTRKKMVIEFAEDDLVITELGATKPAKKVNTTDVLVIDDEKYEVKKTKKTLVNDCTAVCTLGSINLARVNRFFEIPEACGVLVRILDNIIDLNCYPFDSAYNQQKDLRAIGVGVMGEAQMIAEKGYTYGSDEHIVLINNLMESISYHVIDSSSQLAQEREPFAEEFVSWENNPSAWREGLVPMDSAPNIEERLWLKYKLNTGDRDPRVDWESLRERIKKYGIRNAYLMAVAPTSSISILCGTTQSTEPLYSKFWYEENTSGLIPSIAPGWNNETASTYVTAYEVDPKDVITLAAVRQKWIDQGQSINIFVPSDIKGKELSDIYLLAWDLGLKSTYYCRSKSKEIDDKAPTICDISCESCQ